HAGSRALAVLEGEPREAKNVTNEKAASRAEWLARRPLPRRSQRRPTPHTNSSPTYAPLASKSSQPTAPPAPPPRHSAARAPAAAPTYWLHLPRRQVASGHKT